MDFLVKENGFIKFDTLLKAANVTVEDSGMLAVYDLIFGIFKNPTFKDVHLNFFRLLSLL